MTIQSRVFETRFDKKWFRVTYKNFKGMLLAPDGFNTIVDVEYDNLPLDSRELRDRRDYRMLYEHLTNAMLNNAMSYGTGTDTVNDSSASVRAQFKTA